MRKITETTAGAFVNFRKAALGNTWTNGNELYLHGNLIAKWLEDGSILECTLAGWNTPTTRECLNGVLELEGLAIRFVQRDFTPCILSLVTGSAYEINDTDHYLFDVALHKEAELLIAELEKEGA